MTLEECSDILSVSFPWDAYGFNPNLFIVPLLFFGHFGSFLPHTNSCL